MSKESVKNEKTDDAPAKQASQGQIDGGADDVTSLKQEIEALNKTLAEQADKAKEYQDQVLRAKAEVENARRRATIDVENAHKYGSEKFAKELLNVVDSLEKGLEAAPSENPEIKAIRDGLELTYKLMLDTMEKFGIKMFNPMGETFDPKYHEALSMQESTEVEPNKVMTVIQQGFVQHERVLRPARVIVARPQSTAKVDTKA